MSHENKSTPQLDAVAAALAALSPQANSVNRDTLMFRAGMAAAQSAFVSAQPTLSKHGKPSIWLWQLATAGSVTLAVTFGVLYGRTTAGGAATLPLANQPGAGQPGPILPQIVTHTPTASPATNASNSENPDKARDDRATQAEPQSGRLASAPMNANLINAIHARFEPSTGGYLQWRDTALSRGVDTLSYLQGRRESDAEPAASYSELRRDLMTPHCDEMPHDQINSISTPNGETRT